MKNTSTSDQLYDVLKTLHDHTLRAITLAEQTDPVSALTLETSNMILSYLDYKAAVGILPLSRSWSKATLAGCATIRNVLGFSQSSKHPTKATFQSCLRRLSRPPSTMAAAKISRGAKQDLEVQLPTWAIVECLKSDNVSVDMRDLKSAK